MYKKVSFTIVFLTFLTIVAIGQNKGWDGPEPAIIDHLKSISSKFDDYETVLKPDKDEAEW